MQDVRFCHKILNSENGEPKIQKVKRPHKIRD